MSKSRKAQTVEQAKAELDAVIEKWRGVSTFRNKLAGEEFDAAYIAWIRTRWDAGHPWVREVWEVRP